MNINNKIYFIVKSALIAAVYVVLTLVFRPISFGMIQLRISEMLTIMPLFTSAAIPGLFVGCLISNIIGGAIIWDIIFGSIATLIGAILTYIFKDSKPILGPLGPILSNTLFIPLILYYCYGINNYSLIYAFIVIFISETISCGILGLILYRLLYKYNIYKYL